MLKEKDNKILKQIILDNKMQCNRFIDQFDMFYSEKQNQINYCNNNKKLKQELKEMNDLKNLINLNDLPVSNTPTSKYKIEINNDFIERIKKCKIKQEANKIKEEKLSREKNLSFLETYAASTGLTVNQAEERIGIMLANKQAQVVKSCNCVECLYPSSKNIPGRITHFNSDKNIDNIYSYLNFYHQKNSDDDILAPDSHLDI